MMILYHGTSKTRGLQILETNVLKSIGIKRVYENNRLSTTEGYVYLTNSLWWALFYASNAVAIESTVGSPKETILLFLIDIEESELEVDVDQLEFEKSMFHWRKNLSVNSIEDSLKELNSVRVKKCLSIGNEIKGCVELPYPRKNYIQDEDTLTRAIEIAFMKKQKNEEIQGLFSWKMF